MRKIFYSYYIYIINLFFFSIGIKNKIIFLNQPIICKQKWNLLVLNHNSVFDSIILAIICEYNKISFNNIRSISKYSYKKLQNYAFTIFDFFLTKKNMKQDIKNIHSIKNKWIKANIPIQIILYPEGTIFLNQITNFKQKQFLNNININDYKHVIFPHNGIFNLLIENFNIEYIYHINILYKINNKRLIGEWDILTNLANPKLEIIVSFNQFNNYRIDPFWLYHRWNWTDNWIHYNLLDN